MKKYLLIAKAFCLLLFSCSYFSVTAQHEIEFADVRRICINNKKGFKITAVSSMTPGFKTTYRWSTGETTQSVTIFEDNFLGGRVTCKLYCECGGEGISTMELNFPQSNYTISTTNASCNNAQNGSIKLLTSDEGANLLWHGESTKDVHNLMAGDYTFRIMDRFGCLIERSATITEPPAFPLEYKIETTKASCHGLKDGSASISYDNSFQLSVLWDNGARGLRTVKLGGGPHIIQISNGKSCNTVHFNIYEPPNLEILYKISDYNGFPIRCVNSSDAVLDVFGVGGTEPYTIYFNDKISTRKKAFEPVHAEGLPAGNYSVTIIDKNGCTISRIIKIKSPDQIRINFNQANYNSYNTPCNGQQIPLHPSVTGGAGGFSYAWTSRGTIHDSLVSTSPTPQLKAGSYRVTIIDGNGCRLDSFLSIYQPPAVDYEATIWSNSWLFKMAILKLTGGASKKYIVNGRKQKRKLVISFFKRSKQIEFTAGDRNCHVSVMPFVFPDIEHTDKKRTRIDRNGSTRCPTFF